MSRMNSVSTRPITIRKMVEDIVDGKVGIPVFQREFVWNESMVKDLFDSIKNGYPIGSILLWYSDLPLKKSSFVPYESVPESSSNWYVLDGRQRLTAFYGSVLKNRDKANIFNIQYNLKTDSFEFPNRYNRNDDFCIPVADIFDTFTLIGILQSLQTKYKDSPGDLSLLDRAKRLNARMQEYQIIVVELENCNLNEALKVFERINTKGTRLSDTEILQSLTYNPSEKLFSDEIKNIRDGLRPYGFENLSDKDILKCLYPFAGKNFYDASLKNSASLIVSHSLVDSLEQAKKVITLTARFLFEECFVPGERFLPYKNQFFILALYFMRHDFQQENFNLIPPEDYQQLRKWFLYTTIKQSFQNSSLSNVRAITSQFSEFIVKKRTTPIDYEEVMVDNPLNQRININSAKTKLWIIALNWLHNRNSLPSKFVEVSHFGGYNAENLFVTYSHWDREFLTRILIRDKEYLPQILLRDKVENSGRLFAKIPDYFLLDEQLVIDFHSDYSLFAKKRADKLQSVINDLWASVNM